MSKKAACSSGTAAPAAAFQTQATEHVSFNQTGVDVDFGVICPFKPRPLAAILSKVEKHGLYIKSVDLPGDNIKSMLTIHARDAREGIGKVVPLKVQCNTVAKDIQSLF